MSVLSWAETLSPVELSTSVKRTVTRSRVTALFMKFLRPTLTTFAALSVAAICSCNLAWAQASEDATAEEKAAARELAIQGVQLAQAGKCAQAIDPLNRAEQLFHAPTILAWIGDCQIQTGKLVEGTETLREVIREQLADDAPDAFVDAQKRAKALIEQTAPRIGKLNVSVTSAQGPLKDTSQLEVSIDDSRLALALVGAPRPTDPGKHSITVSLPGYRREKVELVLNEGETLPVTITLKRVNGASTSSSSSPEFAADSHSSDASETNPLAWALIGGGAAFLAGGGALGYVALQKKNGLDCPTPESCPKSEEGQLQDARLMATLSTISFGIGGAGVVGGIVVLLLSNKQKNSPPADAYLTPTPGLEVRPELGWASVGLSGRF